MKHRKTKQTLTSVQEELKKAYQILCKEDLKILKEWENASAEIIE